MRVREDGGDGEAAWQILIRRTSLWRVRREIRTWAIDIHEVRVWGLNETLELVLLCFVLVGGMEKIDGESLRDDLKRDS